MKILVIHGPNIHFLGRRKPEIYGSQTLSELNAEIEKEASALGVEVIIFQTNYEGKIIDILTEYADTVDAIVINPGALTHYSYAVRDAIEAVNIPTAEVHLSDISAREPFRQTSVISPVCEIQIKGRGGGSYIEALRYFHDKAESRNL